jgi:membrane protein
MQLVIFSSQISLVDYSALLLKSARFLGEIILFASFYRSLPAVHVRFRLSLVGGVVVSILRETTRAILVWYFSSVSLVNVVYGSLGTIIILLITMEVGARRVNGDEQ